MTFEEFLAYIRENVGLYCTDEYWRHNYEMLPEKTMVCLQKELSMMAINAIATDSSYRHG